MPGRPARMIRSEWCRPPVLALTDSSPVVMPDRPPPEFSAFSAILTASSRRLGEALHAALAAAFLGDPVERAFRRLDLRLGIDLLGGVERLLDHLAADADQRPQQGQVVDLLGEVARADDRGARAGELREIGRPAQLLHLLVRLEQRAQGHRRGDHILVEQPQDLLVDPAVQRLVEMLGAELELDVLRQPVVDHQRAEQRRLRLHILGKSLGCGFGGLDETDWAEACISNTPSGHRLNRFQAVARQSHQDRIVDESV